MENGLEKLATRETDMCRLHVAFHTLHTHTQAEDKVETEWRCRQPRASFKGREKKVLFPLHF